MTPSAFFRAAHALPFASLDTLIGAGGALVIAPHPDDESLGCGALIAETVETGRNAGVVVVSDGTGSHPNSKAFPAERLRALRECEAQAAAGTLGLPTNRLSFLRLPDRRVPSEGLAAKRAADAIAGAAEAIGATALFVSWRLDPHCDHRAAYALARAAQRRLGVKLYEYSIWGERLPLDREPEHAPSGFRLDSQRQRGRKRAAIACHRSQTSLLIDDDPQGFTLDRSMIEAFVNRDEIFLEMGP